MSELSNKVRAIRNDRSQAEFARASGLSLRTICKLEAGELVRLETIQQIARAAELSEPERLDLVVCWLKLAASEDVHKLIIEVKDQPAAIRDADHFPAKIQMLISDTPKKFQEQVYLALQRPEVLRCLPTLNDLYDSLKKSAET